MLEFAIDLLAGWVGSINQFLIKLEGLVRDRSVVNVCNTDRDRWSVLQLHDAVLLRLSHECLTTVLFQFLKALELTTRKLFSLFVFGDELARTGCRFVRRRRAGC